MAGGVGGGHVEAQSQLALGNLEGLADGAGLGEDVDEGADGHGGAGGEVDLALGDVAVFRVDGDAGDLGDGLAEAVLLKEVRLLEPLLAYRAGLEHIVVVLELGLGLDEGVLLVAGYLALVVEVYLGLDAVELEAGDDAARVEGVGARGGVALGEAVGVGGGVGAGAAVLTAAVQIEGVALARAVALGVLAGAHDAVDEVAEGHGDAGDEVGVGGLSGVVEGDAGDLVRGLAYAVGLESLNLLEPLLGDAGGAAHGVVVAELHLGEDGSGGIGGDVAGSVEVGLGLDGVNLAVDNDALAVDGYGVDVDVRLGETVGLGGGVGGAAVAEGQGRLHVKAHGYLAGGNLKRLAGGGLLRSGLRSGLYYLHDRNSAAGQQADAEQQGKCDCGQLLHFVYLPMKNA